MSNVEKMISDSLNEEGKLDCKEAFKIAAKTKEDVTKVGKIAENMGIRIDACELGQFGKLDKSHFSLEAKLRLDDLKDDKNRVTCKDARDAAAGIGLKNIRGTLEKHGMDVTYCQLGCFKEKKSKRLYVKTKTWIENEKGELVFGKGKTQVLEDVERTGSISGAAEKLGMNYKKTWSHVQVLQKGFDAPLVETQKGGGDRGGTTLGEHAHELIEAYKTLQNEIEEFANSRFKELFLKPRNKRERRDS
jgi:molybdate transport repressor ModE-like protein